MTLKSTLKRALFLATIAIVIFYAYYRSIALIEGPMITVATPPPVFATTTGLLLIAGNAVHAKELTLQGRPIFVDLSGNFAEQLLLLPGYNIIELTAKDVRGRETRQTIEAVYTLPYSGVTL